MAASLESLPTDLVGVLFEYCIPMEAVHLGAIDRHHFTLFRSYGNQRIADQSTQWGYLLDGMPGGYWEREQLLHTWELRTLRLSREEKNRLAHLRGARDTSPVEFSSDWRERVASILEAEPLPLPVFEELPVAAREDYLRTVMIRSNPALDSSFPFLIRKTKWPVLPASAPILILLILGAPLLEVLEALIAFRANVQNQSEEPFLGLLLVQLVLRRIFFWSVHLDGQLHSVHLCSNPNLTRAHCLLLLGTQPELSGQEICSLVSAHTTGLLHDPALLQLLLLPRTNVLFLSATLCRSLLDFVEGRSILPSLKVLQRHLGSKMIYPFNRVPRSVLMDVQVKELPLTPFTALQHSILVKSTLVPTTRRGAEFQRVLRYLLQHLRVAQMTAALSAEEMLVITHPRIEFSVHPPPILWTPFHFEEIAVLDVCLPRVAPSPPSDLPEIRGRLPRPRLIKTAVPELYTLVDHQRFCVRMINGNIICVGVRPSHYTFHDLVTDPSLPLRRPTPEELEILATLGIPFVGSDSR